MEKYQKNQAKKIKTLHLKVIRKMGLKIPIKLVEVKANKEMGQMIEQMMMANKEKAVGELAGNDGGMTFFVYTLTADTLVVTDEAEISDDTEEPELKTFVRVK